MKRALLGTSALLGVGMMVHPALAEEPIHLTIGGYYKAAYMGISDDNGVLDDDDDANPELGHNTNRDGLFSDAEIHFLGSTVLDNGLEVGVQIELEGEDQFGDQVDEAYVWFGGGFGELRVGSDDEALHKACVIPPGIGSTPHGRSGPPKRAAASRDDFSTVRRAGRRAASARSCHSALEIRVSVAGCPQCVMRSRAPDLTAATRGELKHLFHS
jgi:hypothetical protein